MKRSARDKILVTAHALFYRDGIRATGIDKVIAASGVAKVTFYRHFPSKNALIIEFLEYRHNLWITWFTEALTRHGAHPGCGLQPLLPTLAEWFDKPDYRGCAFINSVIELGDSFEEIATISKRHKQEMIQIITELLPVSEHRTVLANAAAVAIDGAIVKAQLDRATNSAQGALQSLAILLNALG